MNKRLSLLCIQKTSSNTSSLKPLKELLFRIGKGVTRWQQKESRSPEGKMLPRELISPGPEKPHLEAAVGLGGAVK